MANQANLGRKVSTRSLNWQQMCERSWGSEFFAPDHGLYEFTGGRKFDSTDKYHVGIYYTNNNLGIQLETGNYPDMAGHYLLVENYNHLDQG